MNRKRVSCHCQIRVLMLTAITPVHRSLNFKKAGLEIFLTALCFFHYRHMALNIITRIRFFVVVRFLRLVFGAMSTKTARLLINVATKPKGWQHSWMQLEPRTRSYFVGRNISKQSKHQIKTRMQNADIVVFYIHGECCYRFIGEILAE